MTQNKLIEALEAQMEAWADDSTPSSIQRDKGLVWLEGWFDLNAALSTAQAQEPVDDLLPCDVRLPPATTITAGCSFDTLRLALSLEGRPRNFVNTAPPAPSTPDAREVVEQCAAIAVERSQEWKSAIANGLRRVAVSKDYAEAAQCEAEVIAAALRTKASEIIAAIPSPTPSAPDAALRDLLDRWKKVTRYTSAAQGGVDTALARDTIKMLRALSNSGQMEKGA